MTAYRYKHDWLRAYRAEDEEQPAPDLEDGLQLPSDREAILWSIVAGLILGAVIIYLTQPM